MSKKSTQRKQIKPDATPDTAVTIADYADSRNIDRGDVAAAIETSLEGHSTHPAAELTAAEQASLDEFFGRENLKADKPPEDEQADGGIDRQQEQPQVVAPPIGELVKVPDGVLPYGTRQEGQPCFLVEFLGDKPAAAYAWGWDETEAISRALTALNRQAGRSRYRVRRCESATP